MADNGSNYDSDVDSEPDFDDPDDNANTAMTTIVLTGKDRESSRYISKFEMGKLITTRIQEMSMRSKCYAIDSENYSLEEKAKAEILQGRCPLSIVRSFIRDSIIVLEVFKVNEMKILHPIYDMSPNIYTKV